MNCLIAFEGPDMVGKSEISRALSEFLGVSYFKNKNEWDTDLRDPSYFKNLLLYGGTFLIDFISQVKPSAILDRYYPSEWVYSSFFNRETNLEILKRIDEKFALAGGKIVICRRKDYSGITDDLHSYLDEEALSKLDSLYEEFSKWTKCKTYTLWVDDEDLTRQIKEITEWMNDENV